VFHIFWILGHECFQIRHHITYFTPNSFAGKFSGFDLGFFYHVALLTWSNCGFDSQVEKGQWKRNTSSSGSLELFDGVLWSRMPSTDVFSFFVTEIEMSLFSFK
jgi:hypothetical protein